MPARKRTVAGPVERRPPDRRLPRSPWRPSRVSEGSGEQPRQDPEQVVARAWILRRGGHDDGRRRRYLGVAVTAATELVGLQRGSAGGTLGRAGGLGPTWFRPVAAPGGVLTHPGRCRSGDPHLQAGAADGQTFGPGVATRAVHRPRAEGAGVARLSRGRGHPHGRPHPVFEQTLERAQPEQLSVATGAFVAHRLACRPDHGRPAPRAEDRLVGHC